jgi:hypothetical protein
MALFVFYDVRGVQSFIFAVPRLRYIIGGSALIDRFDRETVRGLPGYLSAGGGRGAFVASDEAAADALERRLRDHAREIGVDLRIGRHADFSEAARSIDRLYPYLPRGGALDGHPCRDSGLYPVSGGGVHPVIGKRIFARGERMGRWFEERLRMSLQEALKIDGAIAFFRNVDAEDEDDRADGRRGSRAIGSRNRWAVVCMDGNDIGGQFRAKAQAGGVDATWVKAMSAALDGCSEAAFVAGAARVIRAWMSDPASGHEDCRDGGELTVPVRPLVVGGDDLTVLVNPRYAFDFVEAACEAFSRESAERAQISEHGDGLWPATGGALSISAGVLFAPVSLPLAVAVPYAEGLLSSAKQRGRAARGNQAAAPPAAVDWESITEGLVDHPAARRQRELVFDDEDLGARVELTCRPYLLTELTALQQHADAAYASLPGSIAHQVLPSLRSGFYDRAVFSARIEKRQAALARDLAEGGDPAMPVPQGSRWRDEVRGDVRVRRTDVVDALALRLERARMSWETAR